MSYTLNKARPYPSEQAAVDKAKVQNQLAAMSAKLNEIQNREEPVYAFRVAGVKDVGSSRSISINRNPGKMFITIAVLSSFGFQFQYQSFFTSL